MAINWHMGGFDERCKGGSYTIASAMAKYPLAVLLQTADYTATYLDENQESETQTPKEREAGKKLQEIKKLLNRD